MMASPLSAHHGDVVSASPVAGGLTLVSGLHSVCWVFPCKGIVFSLQVTSILAELP